MEVIKYPLAPMMRDAAIACEQSDLESAYRWMLLAHRVRPQGPVITRKVETYRKLRQRPWHRLKRLFVT